MTIRSTIRMLPPAARVDGVCGVCNLPATLEFHDKLGDVMLGGCCLSRLLQAERLLSSVPAFTQPQPK